MELVKKQLHVLTVERAERGARARAHKHTGAREYAAEALTLNQAN